MATTREIALAALVQADRAAKAKVEAIRGPEGPPGPRGETGERGPQGAPGPVGERGPQGMRGEVGPMGPRGVVGQRGERGAKGERGDRGAIGPAGPMGERGPQGFQGERGERGLRGIKGERGDQGEQGIKGNPGDIGPMPRHEIKNNRIRFESAPGEWGDWIDLRSQAVIGGGGGRGLFDVTFVSDGYRCNGSEQVLVCENGGTITLRAMHKGQSLRIKRKTGAALTLDGNGKNIDGTSTKTLNVAYYSVDLVFDGTEWLIL